MLFNLISYKEKLYLELFEQIQLLYYHNENE